MLRAGIDSLEDDDRDDVVLQTLCLSTIWMEGKT